eukprot:TRINITY_DN75906_c0_g1_i1.p1 TRINITY_DN75906_c0_g1~~TRINITY_DN75906_c0_g1_i1.p1  ORF type:complete len:234 (+),score=27.23 TRINITY_DN75906_c0_g1_i1:31-702(+)
MEEADGLPDGSITAVDNERSRCLVACSRPTCCYDELRVAPERPLCFIVVPRHSSANRERITQIILEAFNEPETDLVTQTALSMFWWGRKMGMIMDGGDGIFCIVPIHDGHGIANRHEAKMMDANGSSNKEKTYEYLRGNIFTFGDGRFRCQEFLLQPSSFFNHVAPEEQHPVLLFETLQDPAVHRERTTLGRVEAFNDLATHVDNQTVLKHIVDFGTSYLSVS